MCIRDRHKGVLTGSPITDIKITLVAGKAHLKHTEGGDFRQATYRAIRQGLKAVSYTHLFHSPTVMNWFSMTLPIKKNCPPPNNLGMKNELTAGKNTNAVSYTHLSTRLAFKEIFEFSGVYLIALFIKFTKT